MRAKILNASAGSGKTYQLAYKYVHDVIERPESYSAILAGEVDRSRPISIDVEGGRLLFRN